MFLLKIIPLPKLIKKSKNATLHSKEKRQTHKNSNKISTYMQKVFLMEIKVNEWMGDHY